MLLRNLIKMIEEQEKSIYDGQPEEVIEDSFRNLMTNIQKSNGKFDFAEVEITRTSNGTSWVALDTKLKKSVALKESGKKINVPTIDEVSFINNWKLISVFPARITECLNKTVLLEVLIDENEIEEQEYELKFFEGFDLSEVKFFKIKCYERPREQRLVMTDASQSLSRDDFPKVDFSHITNDDLFF